MVFCTSVIEVFTSKTEVLFCKILILNGLECKKAPRKTRCFLCFWRCSPPFGTLSITHFRTAPCHSVGIFRTAPCHSVGIFRTAPCHSVGIFRTAPCHSVVNGSDAPTSCGITYATNFVNLKNLRNFERTVFSYIGGIFCIVLCHSVGIFQNQQRFLRNDKAQYGRFLRNDKKHSTEDSYGMTKSTVRKIPTE
jgi:hypothetical protein